MRPPGLPIVATPSSRQDNALELAEIDLAPVPAGEVRFRVIAAAVNRADVEIRSGKWPITGAGADPFPYTPGLEALGDVVELGAGVSSVAVGDRVIT
jgi:NADPH:quinone reductase